MDSMHNNIFEHLSNDEYTDDFDDVKSTATTTRSNSTRDVVLISGYYLEKATELEKMIIAAAAALSKEAVLKIELDFEKILSQQLNRHKSNHPTPISEIKDFGYTILQLLENICAINPIIEYTIQHNLQSVLDKMYHDQSTNSAAASVRLQQLQAATAVAPVNPNIAIYTAEKRLHELECRQLTLTRIKQSPQFAALLIDDPNLTTSCLEDLINLPEFKILKSTHINQLENIELCSLQQQVHQIQIYNENDAIYKENQLEIQKLTTTTSSNSTVVLLISELQRILISIKNHILTICVNSPQLRQQLDALATVAECGDTIKTPYTNGNISGIIINLNKYYSNPPFSSFIALFMKHVTFKVDSATILLKPLLPISKVEDFIIQLTKFGYARYLTVDFQMSMMSILAYPDNHPFQLAAIGVMARYLEAHGDTESADNSFPMFHAVKAELEKRNNYLQTQSKLAKTSSSTPTTAVTPSTTTTTKSSAGTGRYFPSSTNRFKTASMIPQFAATQNGNVLYHPNHPTTATVAQCTLQYTEQEVEEITAYYTTLPSNFPTMYARPPSSYATAVAPKPPPTKPTKSASSPSPAVVATLTSLRTEGTNVTGRKIQEYVPHSKKYFVTDHTNKTTVPYVALKLQCAYCTINPTACSPPHTKSICNMCGLHGHKAHNCCQAIGSDGKPIIA